MKHLKTTFIFIALLLSISAFSQSKKDYKLVWQDNFNGSAIDSTASSDNQVNFLLRYSVPVFAGGDTSHKR